MSFSPDSPSLVLDASSPVLQGGILGGNGRWLAFERAQGDAITGVPDLLASLLARPGLRVADLGSFVHCEGPGSMLGLRIAAMAVETWRALPALRGRPLFAYRSLAFAAALRALDRPGEAFVVLTSLRRGLFSACDEGGVEVPALGQEAFEARWGKVPRLYVPQRHESVPPLGTEPFAYDVERLPELLASASESFLHPCERAVAYSPSPSTYKFWSAQRHRGGV